MQINDIVERESNAPLNPPAAPRAPVKSTLKWTPRSSQKTAAKPGPQARSPAASVVRVGPKSTAQASSSVTAGPDALSEAEKIHLESVRRLARTSPEEIEREKQRLIDSLDPEVLQSLLKRAEIKEQEFGGSKSSGQQKSADATGAEDIAKDLGSRSEPEPQTIPETTPSPSTASAPLSVDDVDGQAPALGFGHRNPVCDHFSRLANATRAHEREPVAVAAESQAARPALLPREPSTEKSAPAPAHASVHFPPPPEELRAFFPQLPVESEKMAWMQPVAEEEEAEYSEQLQSLVPSQLRFDFHGALIPPRRAASISPSAGLHHHGDAPAAAGYTVPELARLCRSAFPAQRTAALQTLGRILYRLKTNAFHKSTDLQYGLEQLFEHERVVQLIYDAASDRTKNMTVRNIATEALWLLSQTDSKVANS